mgnify:CR=1 FL=1
MLYCGPESLPRGSDQGGATIAEVLRRAWSRLTRKQWLIVYPLALAIIHTLAFLAVYASGEASIRWSAFFTANFGRWEYIRDHFVAEFSFESVLAVAAFAGLAVCLLTAMIRAPFFRAVAGQSYPRAPRGWTEAGNLFVFYLFWYLVLWLLPMVGPREGILAQVAAASTWVVGILVVFADYVIVFEGRGVLRSLHRSLRLLRPGWPAVVIIFIIVQLIYLGIYSLYGLYYRDNVQVFILLPISQLLVEAFVALLADLVLIFLYEDLRRRRPS